MKTATINPICACSSAVQVIDRCQQSTTARCPDCEHCVLLVDHPRIELCIGLKDFHLKRGDGPDQRPLADLAMATRLVDCLYLDRWPSPGTVVDYGIDTREHLGALQHAVRVGVTAYDLDRVMGDGPAITELVQGVPDQPYHLIQFDTAYDTLTWSERDLEER